MRDLPKTREYLADWVKKDPDTVEHILTVALSSKTGKPLNLMLRSGFSSVSRPLSTNTSKNVSLTDRRLND